MIVPNALASAASRRLTRPHRSRNPRPRRVRRVAAVLGASLLTLAACGTPSAPHDDDGAIVLKMADSFATTHPIGRSGTKVFLETLRQDGPDAGLKIDYFESGQLGDQADMPALLRTGTAQIAAVSPAYVGTELPLSNVGDLPGFTQDSCVGADATLEMMQPGRTLFEEELKAQNIHPLWIGYIPAYEAMSGSFPITSADDIKGKIMRSTGGVADRVVRSAGAAAVSMPLGDMYEALSRGTVEGTLASPISVTPYKLEEVLRYSTEGARLGSFTATYSISENVWQGLGSEQRAVFQKAADLAQKASCKELNASISTSKKAMRDAGVHMDVVSAKNRPQWDAISDEVRRNWVDDLDSVGLPSQQVLDEAVDAFAKADSKEGSGR